MKASTLVGAAALAVAAVAVVALLPDEASTAAAAPAPVFREACAAGPAMVCDAFQLGGAGPGRYRRVEVASTSCARFMEHPDGGSEGMGLETKPLRPRADVEIVEGSCLPAAQVVGPRVLDAGIPFLAQACACRRAAGTCQFRGADGGLADVPRGQTAGPGYPPYEAWSGAGCAPKSCVELAGNSSWPSVCPRR